MSIQNLEKILLLTKEQVQALFEKENTEHLYFHDYKHTATVAENCRKAAQIISLNREKALLLEIAAWFHDVGYIYTYQQHEKKSIELMQQFLEKHSIKKESIAQIEAMIAATEVGVKATTFLGLLLKEIDLSYGATQNFKQRGDDLRKEWSININKTYSEGAWKQLQFDFINQLSFESDYGKTYLQPLVNQNIEKLYQ